MLPRWSVLTILVFVSSACFADESESKLLKSLKEVPEVQLLSDEQLTVYQQMREAEAKQLPKTQRAVALCADDLKLHKSLLARGLKEGLPLSTRGSVRDMSSARLVIDELRQDGFGLITPPLFGGKRLDAFASWCDKNEIEKYPASIPTLLQILQVEDASIRLTLVKQLARDKSFLATHALTNRALMDMSSEVRSAAVEELQKRDEKGYLKALLDGLRYPWPPIADHAADALIKIKPQGSPEKLVDLLDLPDPKAAFPLKKGSPKMVVAELVRINHLRNCLLCHPPVPQASPKSLVAKKLVQGMIPTLGKPISASYYDIGSSGSVRADTTFMRQHFSALIKVENADPWPEMQRFDFVTRIRKATPEEIEKSKSLDYPQRRAVLRALEKVTGKKVTDSPAITSSHDDSKLRNPQSSQSDSGRWRELLKITKAKDEGK